jgi:hypothetical protein
MPYFEPNQRRIVQEILIERHSQKKRSAAGDGLFLNACEKLFGTTDGLRDVKIKRELFVKIAAIALASIEKIDAGTKVQEAATCG